MCGLHLSDHFFVSITGSLPNPTPHLRFRVSLKAVSVSVSSVFSVSKMLVDFMALAIAGVLMSLKILVPALASYPNSVPYVQLAAGHFRVDAKFSEIIHLLFYKQSSLPLFPILIQLREIQPPRVKTSVFLFPVVQLLCKSHHSFLSSISSLSFISLVPPSSSRGHNKLITCLSASRVPALIRSAHQYQINFPKVPFSDIALLIQNPLVDCDIPRIMSKLICLVSKAPYNLALYSPFLFHSFFSLWNKSQFWSEGSFHHMATLLYPGCRLSLCRPIWSVPILQPLLPSSISVMTRK